MYIGSNAIACFFCFFLNRDTTSLLDYRVIYSTKEAHVPGYYGALEAGTKTTHIKV